MLSYVGGFICKQCKKGVQSSKKTAKIALEVVRFDLFTFLMHNVSLCTMVLDSTPYPNCRLKLLTDRTVTPLVT